MLVHKNMISNLKTELEKQEEWLANNPTPEKKEIIEGNMTRIKNQLKVLDEEQAKHEKIQNMTDEEREMAKKVDSENKDRKCEAIYEKAYQSYQKNSTFSRGIKKIIGKEPNWAEIKKGLYTGELDRFTVVDAMEQGKKYKTTK